MPPAARRPSPAWGLRQAMVLWKVVVAVWLLQTAAHVPTLVVVAAALEPRLAHLPAETAPGDLFLVVLSGLREARGLLVVAVLAGVLLLWLGTVVWHAGTVRWLQWSGGGRPRLAEVLGLGLVGFWPYARLAAAAAAATTAALLLVWMPVLGAAGSAYAAMADNSALAWLAVGIILSAATLLLLWAATLRAAWLLALPDHRSAVMAWLRGFDGAVRRPVSSIGTLLLWAVPALVLSLLPLFLGWRLDIAGGAAATVLSQLTALLRAFCWVALFLSFAPVSGLWPKEKS